MYCKHCYKMIEDNSQICPHCGKSQAPQKPLYKKLWFWVLLPIVLFLAFAIVRPKSDISKFEYIAAAELMVEDRLKSPSTAEFCHVNDYTVAVAKDAGLAIVKGYVDAQNSFGAVVRTEFAVELDISGSGNPKWICAEIGDNSYGKFVDADFEILR